MRRILFSILPVLFAATAIAQTAAPAASRGSVLPFKATETTLPNGLKAIIVPTGFPSIVSVQIPVQTGSRNEVEPGKSGFAHFFEHMMFRGTQKYPPEAYDAIITKAGASQNAYTTDDYTNYHVTFAKEDLEKMLEIEADRFQSLSYPLAAFKTESRAVLGEYNKNSADPGSKLGEVMRDAAFTTHTYKHTTMGFIKDIEDMPNQYEYSKTFFRRWYRPENTAIIVAGDVDAAKVMPLIEKYWGGWKRGSGEKIAIPQEPPAQGAVYAHVPWQTPTAPWVAIAFHGPAFSETQKDSAAIKLFMDINFGKTADVYRKLVEQEQKVDQFRAAGSDNADPALITIFARVKNFADVQYVRDEILRAVAAAKASKVDANRLDDAKMNAYYGFIARLDNTDTIAATLARYVGYTRSYATIDNAFRVMQSLTPDDVATAANAYLTDRNLVVTTLAQQKLPDSIGQIPPLASFAPAGTALGAKQFIIQKSEIPQIRVKLLFDVGSAHDPAGKEGLARLAAAMIADAGSKDMQINEINKALYPIAGSFGAQVDKEMTNFTLSVHRDKWDRFAAVVLPQLLDPGWRKEDFERLKTNQKNALLIDLRSNNEEELGKEWLQNRIFAGTPYGHAVLGTVAGLDSITLDDVKAFIKAQYTSGNLKVGINGDVPDSLVDSLKAKLGQLPNGSTPRAAGIAGKNPKGLSVDIIQKETRATAISFGQAIDINRSSEDFAALNVARAWLGEHRSSMSHLYERMRETRGMNYGDYAYIEAFPRGMYLSYPDPNSARQKQIFEVWIRPVVPENARMALRIALYEVGKLVSAGLTQQQFEATRDYMMKNVFLSVLTQNQQIGYALDSDWYGIGEYTRTMRAALARLSVNDVNRAIRKYIHPNDFRVVMIARDAEVLKTQLVTDAVSVMKYDGEKPKALLDEDKVIGSMQLGIKPGQVTIVPVDSIFAK